MARFTEHRGGHSMFGTGDHLGDTSNRSGGGGQVARITEHSTGHSEHGTEHCSGEGDTVWSTTGMQVDRPRG